jgi:hypothetical protein
MASVSRQDGFEDLPWMADSLEPVTRRNHRIDIEQGEGGEFRHVSDFLVDALSDWVKKQEGR